jgi:formate dehydrogenase iron-sulfur subunit
MMVPSRRAGPAFAQAIWQKMSALEECTLVDTLIEEQRLLTAASRFAQRHENDDLPQQARYYRDLIPLSRPKEGQQYAFEVDLDQCSGCKACVTACHNLNGLDEAETWRSVGLLQGGTAEEPVQRFVTTACHHCIDPACLNGCPVNAYEKDAQTGIVRHLDDQCIGCQYCILKCPYDVPKYHQQKGIVRKCDLCSSRLEVGEAPACVQACPNEAIRITVVNRLQIAVGYGGRPQTADSFLPSAPPPDYTRPATKYKTRRALPANMQAGDIHKLKPEPSHLPLIFMLVLTELSAGAFCTDWVLSCLLPGTFPELRRMQVMGAFAFGLIGLAAAILHLGRPLLAWRAFMGLRRSWLSREIVVFGTYALLTATYAGFFWLRSFQDLLFIENTLGACAVIVGLLGVFCSHMIYHDTHRVFWQGMRTAGRFFGTTFLLGAAFALATTVQGWRMGLLPQAGPLVLALASVLALITIIKLGWELSFLSPLRDADLSLLKRSALLMIGELRLAAIARFACGLIGGVLLPGVLLCTGPMLLTTEGALPWLALASFVLCALGELLERYLFFTAVVAPKMPGSA